MSFLKTMLVMLFSLALISSQTVFDLNAATDGQILPGQTCTCCACAKTDCCMKQSSGAPTEPLASLPVNSNSQTQQFIAAVCTLLLQQPLSRSTRVVVSFYSSPTASAVPLFKQNCSFLI